MSTRLFHTGLYSEEAYTFASMIVSSVLIRMKLVDPEHSRSFDFVDPMSYLKNYQIEFKDIFRAPDGEVVISYQGRRPPVMNSLKKYACGIADFCSEKFSDDTKILFIPGGFYFYPKSQRLSDVDLSDFIEEYADSISVSYAYEKTRPEDLRRNALSANDIRRLSSQLGDGHIIFDPFVVEQRRTLMKSIVQEHLDLNDLLTANHELCFRLIDLHYWKMLYHHTASEEDLVDLCQEGLDPEMFSKLKPHFESSSWKDFCTAARFITEENPICMPAVPIILKNTRGYQRLL